MKYDSAQMLLAVDLAATVFLGVEGAMAAIEGNLDIFGILVLSFATALGGGVIRDLLIGAIPPAATEDPRSNRSCVASSKTKRPLSGTGG